MGCASLCGPLIHRIFYAIFIKASKALKIRGREALTSPVEENTSQHRQIRRCYLARFDPFRRRTCGQIGRLFLTPKAFIVRRRQLNNARARSQRQQQQRQPLSPARPLARPQCCSSAHGPTNGSRRCATASYVTYARRRPIDRRPMGARPP